MGVHGIRRHRSDAANQNALNALKNPHLTGRPHPGQGQSHRSSTANQTAQNVSKNPNLASNSSSLNSYVPEGNFLYFYHPDHLGSTAYVTDGKGQLYEHMEYFPFGETWADQRSNTQRVPYLFTGKEYDEETGLYYFGARYYDPRTSVWESPDPILGAYLSGKRNGGVFTPENLALFGYVQNNPLIYTDPDGRSKIGEFFFLEAHPYAAVEIGADRRHFHNISSNARRFSATGMSPSAKGPLLRLNPSHQLGEVNAFRHGLWQAKIANTFDEDIAKQAGGAHERLGTIDTTKRVFKTEDAADEVADLLNNVIGRSVGLRAKKGTGMRDLAGALLEEFHNKGMWVGARQANGTFKLNLEKLSNAKYIQMKRVLKHKDDNGEWIKQLAPK